MQKGLEEQRARHRALITKRKNPEGRALIWRPRKVHRKSSFMNGACVQNVLRQWRPEGLFHFEIPKEVEERQLAIRWPRCSITPDMDATNV